MDATAKSTVYHISPAYSGAQREHNQILISSSCTQPRFTQQRRVRIIVGGSLKPEGISCPLGKLKPLPAQQIISGVHHLSSVRVHSPR
ncbi:hypothetical protein D3C73_1490940 [compost metagenome]